MSAKKLARSRRLLRASSSLFIALIAALIANGAEAVGGVGLVTTAKTLPPATVAVIDPESGTSSGTGTTDVRVSVGDVILFRFRYFPVPQQQIEGINAWLTEYVPDGLQVVGVRLIDENGLTVRPHLPGLAENGTAVSANNWNTTPCSGAVAGAPCPPEDGGIAQLYQDTGIFYSTDARTARSPDDAFIRLTNGLIYPDPAVIGSDSNFRAALGVSSPFRAHNAWDRIQATLFGANGGNTPHLFGSPVAGNGAHYRYEATCAGAGSSTACPGGGVPTLAHVQGPWNRILYPGSVRATGGAATSREGSGMGRYVVDAGSTGFDVTPNNSLPASTNALRIAIGDVRGGEATFVEIAFRVLSTPLDSRFTTGRTCTTAMDCTAGQTCDAGICRGGDVNCGESFGGDIAGTPTGADADNNMWSVFVPSPACVFLNLLFDITSDRVVRDNSDSGAPGAGQNDMQFTIRARNLSRNPRTNVWVRQKYNPSRISPSDDVGFPAYQEIIRNGVSGAGTPSCTIANCDGDGFSCVYWSLGTLDPSDEVEVITNFEVSNGGDPVTQIRADFTSNELGTITGDPCMVGGALASPGFVTQESVQIRSLGIVKAQLTTTTASVATTGGTAAVSGNLTVEGTQGLTIQDIFLNLPFSNWRITNSGGTATEDILVNGVRYECDSFCGTSTPRFEGITEAMAVGDVRTVSFSVQVPAGTAAGNHPIDMHVVTSQSGYGAQKEFLFNDITYVSVGGARSEPPVLDCPVLSSWSSIPGDGFTTTTAPDGTIIRVYFNGILRGRGTVAGGAGRFSVVNGPTGAAPPWAGPTGTFGALYGGLEVRATAQRPGQNESALSDACFVTVVSQCQDGIDNDGDGNIDYPADPGCSSPTDGDETSYQCSDGLDNDGDGYIDWPADPECDNPDENSEGGAAQCNDGIDNDGDGAIDFGADSDCTSSTDRTESPRRACNDYINNDGSEDSLVDYPDDPGCDSPNDDSESDWAYTFQGVCFGARTRACSVDADCMGAGPCTFVPDDIRARLLVVFDTSGSMNWHACADEFTGGDGSNECLGGDVSCGTCPIGTNPYCGDGVANDSRVFQAREGLRNVVAGFGEIEFGLMRFHQRARDFGCPTTNASAGAGGWIGGGAAPCGGGFAGGDLLVRFSPENEYPMLEWMDNDSNHPTGEPPAELDYELRGSGTTPIAGSLDDALSFLTGQATSDPVPPRFCSTTADCQSGYVCNTGSGECELAGVALTCRPYRVILITDGQETCAGSPTASAAALNAAGFPVYVIGFATPDPTVRAQLNAIASSGGTDGGAPGGDAAIFVSNPVDLSAAMSDIVNETILTETCNGRDDDCDLQTDEGFTLYCDRRGLLGPPTAELVYCTPPAETACDGVDDNCNGVVDEGVRNACGDCGPVPTEVCNGVDDDCDGPIDEGGVCTGCVPSPEICDGIDNNCGGGIDEGLTRSCSSACGTGVETCSAGSWGGCTAPGGGTETCNGSDDDCDGLVDEGTSLLTSCGTCGGGVLRCVGGTQTCTGDRTPTTEVCNNIDDNCNGSTDEGLSRSCSNACGTGTETCVAGVYVGCTAPSPGVEDCDNFDDDCDGRVDEGVTRACSSACGSGTEVCVAGAFTGCDAPLPSTEVCNGVDDNCNGSIDEGLGGASCASGVGVCVTGTTVCTGGALSCTCPAGYDSVIDAARGPFCVPTGSSLTEVCDGTLDEDCDGLVDESLTRSCSTICGSGTEVCSGGAYTGCTAPTPDTEVCDNYDNDCDGSVDESLTRTCGTDEGECTVGTETCAMGVWGMCSGVEPMAETCNSLDDDCDGRIDEGLDLGLPCGDGRGECVPGQLTCVSGAIVCGCPPGFARRTRVDPGGVIVELCAPDDGGTGPLVEVCNALDDDCDGPIDEALPLGGVCGDAEGACVPGMEQCVDGAVVCVGEVPSSPEVCDCEDNDCDGMVDEEPTTGSLCPGESVCLDCSCALPCADSEFGRCPAGRIQVENAMGCFCVAPRCDDASCAGETVSRDGEVQCAPDSSGVPECVCRSNECTFPCDGVSCETPTVCNPSSGRCVEDNCRGLGCPAGEICDPVMVLCVADPCATAGCAADQACRAGVCETSCATVTCGAGEICRSGACETDLCAGVSCPMGSGIHEHCDPETGMCVDDMCFDVMCPVGSECDFRTGSCRADACTYVRCPEGQYCFEGECRLEDMPMVDAGTPDGAVTMPDGAVVTPDGGEGMDSGPPPDEEERVLAAGGCMCEAAGAPRGTPSGLALMLGLLGLVIWRRRRNG